VLTRVGLCLGLACAACVRYQPRSLEPASHVAEVLRRDLGDSLVASRVGRYAGRPEANRWTDRQLALAALTFRSDLRRRRAEWRAASAALRTAGERPGIGVQGEVERRLGGRDEGHPWVVGLSGLFQLELGGKRGARLQAARAGVALAEGRLVAAARSAAAEARLAAAALAQAIAEAEDARQETRALEEVHRLERARFEEAALGASELARTAAEIQVARLGVAGAERDLLEARAALAAALALPARALDSLDPVVGTPGTCPPHDASDAAARRPEIAIALAEYAGAEARLRLEVARQFPDLELGPGFVWDEGVSRWALAFALPALLGSRNRGAIREAEAAREVARLRVAEAQDSVLGAMDLAAQRCRGAVRELAAADSVVAGAERLQARERAAYDRGETSSLEPARAELQVVRARRARRAAERRLLLAALELELAGGGPPSAEGPWPDPRDDPDEEVTGP
jgi:outer membrane protein TolC